MLPWTLYGKSLLSLIIIIILYTHADITLNLDSLLIQLQDKVTKKWHEFGAALGVEKEILDRCVNYSPEQGMIETLDHWLRSSSDTERSWGEVARALRKINHQQLAKEIESIDKTGSNYTG